MHTAVTTYVKDLLERVGATFIQAFLATLIGTWAASGLDVEHWRSVTDWSALKHILIAAALAGLAAVLSLVKGLVATWVGDKGSASLVDAPAPARLAASPVAAPVATPEVDAALARAQEV